MQRNDFAGGRAEVPIMWMKALFWDAPTVGTTEGPWLLFTPQTTDTVVDAYLVYTLTLPGAEVSTLYTEHWQYDRPSNIWTALDVAPVPAGELPAGFAISAVEASESGDYYVTGDVIGGGS